MMIHVVFVCVTKCRNRWVLDQTGDVMEFMDHFRWWCVYMVIHKCGFSFIVIVMITYRMRQRQRQGHTVREQIAAAANDQMHVSLYCSVLCFSTAPPWNIWIAYRNRINVLLNWMPLMQFGFILICFYSFFIRVLHEIKLNEQ